jgi:hypothetical protein
LEMHLRARLALHPAPGQGVLPGAARRLHRPRQVGIEMDDGAQAEAGPGEVVVIEPGHDAWTVGEEPCVFIDFGESVSKSAAGE